MKISKETFEVLQNYAIINNGLVVDEEKCLKTISKNGGIISLFDTIEEFPFFSIWDLAKFNALVSEMGIADCDFNFNAKDNVVISSGGRRVRYEHSDAGFMKDFEKLKDSSKYKAYDAFDFKFEISADDLKKLRRISSIFGFKHEHGIIKLEMENGTGKLTIFSDANESKSTYDMDITGEGSGVSHTQVADLIMINSDYVVNANEKTIKFQSKNIPLIYFVSTVMIDK